LETIHLIICNPFAGAGRSAEIAKQVETAFKKEQIAFDTYFTLKTLDVEGMEQAILAKKYAAITIVGGDGSVNDVINALPNFEIPLHLIPAGSGNDLQQVISGKTLQNSYIPELSASSPVDIWQCNGRRFHNGVGIGFDGSVARYTQYSKITWLPLQLKYWVSIFRNLFLYRSPNYTISIGEKTFSQRSFMISVANGPQYGGGFKVAPSADTADGLLDIIVIEQLAAWKRPFYIPLVEKGKHLKLKIVKSFQDEKVRIESDELIPAHIDGETFEAKVFEFHFEGQLKVLH
jgi:YegS/Rv2252/BmrU family lipid kinase